VALKLELEVEPGFDSVREDILGLPKKLQEALLVIVEEIMIHIVKRSRLNAPILEGDLRESIKYEKPKITSSGSIESAVGSNLAYALRHHEEPFNLGPISAIQPSTPEGGVGNKFISRAIDYRRKKYAEIIFAAVMLSLEQGGPVKPKTKQAD
jgi:hypothetical protein